MEIALTVVSILASWAFGYCIALQIIINSIDKRLIAVEEKQASAQQINGDAEPKS
jgi:hypothetical protein